MKSILSFLLALFSFTAYCQIVNLNITQTSSYIPVTAPYANGSHPQTYSYMFSGTIPQYSTILDNRGLHFLNKTTTEVFNTFNIANTSSQSILGVQGKGTKVIFKGKSIQKHGGSSRAHVVLKNGGHLYIHKDALIDFILETSFFTRQFWVSGDGTGIFELDPLFVSDHTDLGRLAKGVGSMRFSNTIFVTHHDRSHPLGYRPKPISPAGIGAINSHLVFENQAGSVWRILTNDQNFKGGLWVYVNTCIDTQKNLDISGENSVWSDYTNYGGVQLIGVGNTLCKIGPADLIFSGTQSYNERSTIRVEEGRLDLKSNTTTNNPGKDLGGKFTNKNDLNIVVESKGILKISAPIVKFDSLVMTGTTSVLETNINSTLETNYSKFNGILKVSIPDGSNLTTGKEFKLFNTNKPSGNFANIILPDNNGQIQWNTSQLLTEGKIIVQKGNITSENRAAALRVVSVFPNPASSVVNILGFENENFDILNSFGQTIRNGVTDAEGKINVSDLEEGIYHLRLIQNSLRPVRLVISRK